MFIIIALMYPPTTSIFVAQRLFTNHRGSLCATQNYLSLSLAFRSYLLVFQALKCHIAEMLDTYKMCQKISWSIYVDVSEAN